MAGGAAAVAGVDAAVAAHLPSTGVSPSRLRAATGGSRYILVRRLERPPANSTTLDCVRTLVGSVRRSRSQVAGSAHGVVYGAWSCPTPSVSQMVHEPVVHRPVVQGRMR